jgi:hypothetical protein
MSIGFDLETEEFIIVLIPDCDSMQELSQMAPGREWRLIEVNATLADIDVHRNHLLGRLRSPANPTVQ